MGVNHNFASCFAAPQHRITARSVGFNSLFAACFSIKSDFTDRNCSPLTNKHPKQYMSLTNYTLSCFLLSSICVQVSHMISFSSASVPQPAWKRMNLTNRLASAELLLLLVEGPSHRHISVPQRLVSISATFFFSAANVEADAKLQNQAACSGKLTELKS